MQLRAPWLFPGSGPPLADVVVTIHNGRIQSVEPESGAHSHATDLGHVAIIPGLINAHTHLEFSQLTTPLEPRRQFASWIEAVIQSRRSRSDSPLATIRQGWQESLRAGSTGLGEIATTDWVFEQPRADARPRTLVFREYLGLSEEKVIPLLEQAELFLRRSEMLDMVDLGLSPHAPYSVHPQLFRGLCELAATRRVPLAMHLAESPEELELLRHGTGSLVDLLTRLGVWQPGAIPTGSRPLDYLQELARAPRALVIHGNFLAEDELDFLAAHPRLSVVYCPRTHRAMQRGDHPWLAMRARGINVAIGTDSRASNPNLSLWEELQFLSSLAPQLPASELLQLATVNAARGLGWSDCGTVTPGASADLCVVSLDSGAQDPESALLSGCVSKVMHRGHWH